MGRRFSGNKPAQRRVTKLARITSAIAGKISTGALAEGDRLPSEERLALDFHVSLGTLQKALARLAQQGLIIREHGRGTFVARTRRAPAELRYLTFKDGDGRDLPLFVHVLSVKSVRQQGPWSSFLGSAESFIRIERMINVGGEFELFSEFFLREEEFLSVHKLDAHALERTSLREMLRQQFSLPTERVERRIRWEPLPDRICTRLGATAGAAGFAMELLGFTTDDRPLCYQRVFAAQLKGVLVVPR